MIPDLNDLAEIEKIIKYVDPTVRLWDFTHPWVSHKHREFDFTDEDFSISIIDPFKGIIPSLISQETLIEHTDLPLIPTVLLDSNVMASLHLFVTAPEKMAEKHKKVVVKLLDYLILEKVDYNPAFYYLESFSKSANAQQKIIEYTKSILTLHAMDELHFMQKRVIRNNTETLEKYAVKFGTDNIDEMARRQYGHFKKESIPITDWKIAYLVILKAVLIQHLNKTNIQSKLKKLYNFIYEIFGALLAKELYIAVFYFSGKIDKFIPIKKGSNFEIAIYKLKSTAWDLYLLRLPELFLCDDISPITLATVCTGDKSVQYIGRKYRIRKLYSQHGKPFPELEIDFSDISNPKSNLQDLIQKTFNEFETNREKRRNLLTPKLATIEIDEIIYELEFEVKKICENK